VALIAAYGLVCRSYVHANWTDPNRWERRIAQSPHYVFLASCAKELWSGDASGAFADVDESDFADEQAVAPPRWTDGIPPGQRPKNVVWILLESTSAEYLGLYGGRHNNTPHLERLAREGGVVFDNAYVQSPSSCNSLAAITASVYPPVGWGLIVRDSQDLAVPTVAETLQERGYRTCFAHSGYWSWKDRDAYLRRNGADRLIDADSLPGKAVNSWGVADRDMFRASLDWIDERPDQPFFLFAYTIETHHPYVAREPLVDFGVDDEDFNRYLNSIAEADRTIAWLMEELKRRGLIDSTLVVVTSDHGESFGQHNQRIHSFAVYEPAVRVPLLLLHPSLLRLPRRIGQVRQQIDIAPTIVDLLGFEPPAAWQGRDLFDRDLDRRAYFFACGNELVVGLRDGDWKYHFYVDSGYEELFDVAADPRELKNLAQRQPRRCAEYKRRVGGLVQYQRRFLAGQGVD
jgi:arylsulfatase A-like enzyme